MDFSYSGKNYDANYQYDHTRLRVKNLAGDIIGLIDGSGNTVVEYTYDSWGNPSTQTGSLASKVGKQNPFWYKGYYYDSKSGLYYLVNRYYDSEIKRFICADKLSIVKDAAINAAAGCAIGTVTGHAFAKK